MNEPLIAWNNLLAAAGVAYVMDNGAESTGAPVSNAFTWDILKTAIVEADAGGIVKFTVTLPAGAGFTGPFGAGGFGGGGFGGIPSLDTIIFGASRHDSGGFRTPATANYIVSVDGTPILTEADVWPENKSIIRKVALVSATAISFEFNGYAANELVTIPELFAGPSLAMPFVDLGFDSYHEIAVGPTFVSESGREYPNLRFRKVELSPVWSSVPTSYWDEIEEFRENAIELRNPMWFAWKPDDAPAECYMMRHKPISAPFRYRTQTIKNFSLKLSEAI